MIYLYQVVISGTDKLEVLAIYKAYFWGLNFREYHKIWPYMVQYLQFRILEFPLIKYIYSNSMKIHEIPMCFSAGCRTCLPRWPQSHGADSAPTEAPGSA